MLVGINCPYGQTNQTVTLADDKFQIDAVLDHGNAGRYSTGMLFAAHLLLAWPPIYQERCREYSLSEEISCMFCGSCSYHLFRHHKSNDEYMVASGSFSMVETLSRSWGIKMLRRYWAAVWSRSFNQLCNGRARPWEKESVGSKC